MEYISNISFMIYVIYYINCIYIYTYILHILTFNLKYVSHYHFPVNRMFIVIFLLLLLQEV